MKVVKLNQPKTEASAPVQRSSPPDWPYSRLQNQIDQLLEESFDRWWEPAPAPLGAGAHTIDVFEDKDQVIVKTVVPGLKKDELEVSLTGNTLHITGKRKEEKEHNRGGARLCERYSGDFRRSVPLPVAVDCRKIEARYKDGVLTIRCPKAPNAKPKPKEIKIG